MKQDCVPFLLSSLWLSVLWPPFLKSGCTVFNHFTLSLFIKALQSRLSVLYISSSGQNRSNIFHITVHVLLQHLTMSLICARNGLFRRQIFPSDKYLILLFSRYPACRGSLVLLQGLVGTYSARLPLGMMSFQFGCMYCKRERKKGEHI